MTLTFRLLKPSERHSFKAFHNTLFPNTNASDEWFEWYFDKIGAGATRVHAAFDGNEIVGSWCVEPKDLMTDHGSILKVGRCFAVGIHHNYRRNGLFVELSKHAIDVEKSLTQYEYILGFPQEGKPVIAGHLKAGWDHVQHIDIKSFELKPKKFVPLKSVKRVHDFTQFPFVQRRNIGGFADTPEYRNLRWIEHPDNHYICLNIGEAYIVLKPYATACHILDIHGTYEQVRHLLDAAKTLAWRHRWQELTIWSADNDYHVADVRTCDFVDGATCGLSVELLAVKINASTPLKKFELASWHTGSEESY